MDEETKEKVYEALEKAKVDRDIGSPDIEKFDSDIEVRGGTFYKFQIENLIKITTEHGCNFYVTTTIGKPGKVTWVIH